MPSDEEYMEQALRLAERGRGWTSPNPMVGAVIVWDGQVVGQGFHPRAGQPHAEIYALREAGEKARGATIYVNLEPCCHYGKTPPCNRALIKQGIRRVVCALRDPNPLVNGRGIRELQSAGIEVKVGLLEEKARRLNEAYLKYIQTGLPFVTLKVAQTLDGRIATRSGHSRWITGEEARRYVHQLRHEHDAVLVGVGTVLTDDPQLTVRLVEGKNPVRIVLDSSLRIPLGAKLVSGEDRARTIVATTGQTDPKKAQILREAGVEVWVLGTDDRGRVDLTQVMHRAGETGITSLLIEGGAEVFTSALKARVVDKVLFFIAPKLVGEGIGPVGELGVDCMEQAIPLSGVESIPVGNDILIVGYLH